MLHRMTPILESNIHGQQVGSLLGRGCIDLIFTLFQLLETHHMHSLDNRVFFLHLKGAFDSVDWRVLFTAL